MSAHVPINNIIPFSLVDGPGSRTSIFVQGCNLRCLYCHNPETQQLCVGCGLCVKHCPAGALSLECGSVVWDESKCTKCDTCIAVCPHRSSPRIKYLTAQQIFDQVKGYVPFIRGITTSGGECMLYPEFLTELFTLASGIGLSCLIDSNGTIDFEHHQKLLELSDGVMLDLKAWDDSWFQSLTGASGVTVRKNLAYLADKNKLAELRIIVTEGYNDALDAIRGAATVLGPRAANTRLRLMRFRPFGVKGEMAAAPTPTDAKMDEAESLARELGFKTIQVS